jgi:branched-chain amino acid transport system permease protein
MDLFISQLPAIIVDGIVFGLQLSLISVGIVMIFGLGRILNLSHGELAVVAGIVTALLIPTIGTVPAVLIGITTSTFLGVILYRVVLFTVFKLHGEHRTLIGFFVTLGLALLLHGYLTNQYTGTILILRPPITTVTISGYTFRVSSILAGIISALLLIGLAFFLKRTRVGKAIRAVSQNEVGAMISGIPVSKILLIVFVIGAALAGSGGIIRGLSSNLESHHGIELTILALLVAVVGGVRSVFGTMIAGIILGVVYMIVNFLIGTYISFVVLLISAATTILIKPQGLLGEKD